MQKLSIFNYDAKADLVNVLRAESTNDMSYLKIFPLLISVQKDGINSYVGVLRCGFVRYGYMPLET